MSQRILMSILLASAIFNPFVPFSSVAVASCNDVIITPEVYPRDTFEIEFQDNEMKIIRRKEETVGEFVYKPEDLELKNTDEDFNDNPLCPFTCYLV